MAQTNMDADGATMPPPPARPVPVLDRRTRPCSVQLGPPGAVFGAAGLCSVQPAGSCPPGAARGVLGAAAPRPGGAGWVLAGWSMFPAFPCWGQRGAFLSPPLRDQCCEKKVVHKQDKQWTKEQRAPNRTEHASVAGAGRGHLPARGSTG